MVEAHNAHLIIVAWLVVALSCGMKFWQITSPLRLKQSHPSASDAARRQLERLWQKS